MYKSRIVIAAAVHVLHALAQQLQNHCTLHIAAGLPHKLRHCEVPQDRHLQKMPGKDTHNQAPAQMVRLPGTQITHPHGYGHEHAEQQ
jgi:hypothetical protein